MQLRNRNPQPKSGEFVGNRPQSTLDLVGPDKKSLREKYRIGPPQACPAGSVEEMKRRGFVGIYQKSPTRIFRVLGTDVTVRFDENDSRADLGGHGRLG